MTFFEKITRFDSRPALVQSERSITYVQLLAEVAEHQKHCAWATGKTVELEMSSGMDSAVSLFALAFNKSIAIPTLGPSENPHSFAELRVSGQSLAPIGPSAESQILNDFKKQKKSGLILTSSGTTGVPKTVLHNFDRLLDKYLSLKTPLSTLLVFPLNHVSGLETLISVLSAGGTVIFPESLGPDSAMRSIQKNPLDFISCTPSFFKMLLLQPNSEGFLSKLSFVNLGGEKTRHADLQRFQEILPSVDFRQAFGTTETTNFRTYSTDGETVNIGTPGKDYEIRSGKLWLRSPYSMLGYLQPDQPAKEWFVTGDLVESQSDGTIRFLGRDSQVINVGGEKVLPAEVEEVLLRHESVVEARVFGMPNALLGQVVQATVVVANPVNASDLRTFCRRSLPDFKVPFRIQFVDDISVSDRLKAQY